MYLEAGSVSIDLVFYVVLNLSINLLFISLLLLLLLLLLSPSSCQSQRKLYLFFNSSKVDTHCLPVLHLAPAQMASLPVIVGLCEN